MTDTAESTTMPSTKPVESVSTESSAPRVAAASTSSTPTPAPAPAPQLPTTSSTSSPLSSSESSAKKDDATASKKRPAESTTHAASPKEASVTTSDVSTAAAKTATTTTPSSTEPEAPAKRAKTDDFAAVAGVSSTSSNNTANTKSSTGSATTTASTEDLLDLAVTLGYEAGDRLQVQWEIDTPGKESFVKWWAATLLDFDGRTVDEVAIRQIHYEACPEMGFLDESIEDVVFLGDDLLVSPDRTTQLTYRRMKRTKNGAEDSDDNEEDVEQDDIFWYNESDMDEQLNTILMGALTKNERVWKSLEPAKQAHIADQIRIKKAKLLEVLRSQKQVITSENIPAILQQAFGSRRA